MNQEPVGQFLSRLINEPSQLLQGYSLICKRIKQSPQFVSKCIQFLSNDEESIKKEPWLYFQAITVVHPPILDHFADLSQQIQEDVRGGLLNAVVALHDNLKAMSALGLMIREIIEIDTLDPWVEPIQELLKWLAEDMTVIEGGIEFFIYLLKETPYNNQNSQLPIYKLAPMLLECLFQLLANSQLSETVRQKLFYLVLQLIKTFSIYDGVNDSIVKESFDGTYDLWMSLFLSVIQSTLDSNLRVKRYTMKILVILFRDMQRYIGTKHSTHLPQIYIIWEFCYKLMPMYLWNAVWEEPYEQFNPKNQKIEKQVTNSNASSLYYDDDPQALNGPIEALTFTILEFLSVLTSVPQLSVTIRISIHHLTNCLFHYMLLTQFETITWRNNPTYFMMYSSSMDYEVTIRNKVIGILNELIEKTGDYAIQAILLVSEKFLMNFPEEETSKSIMSILSSIVNFDNLNQLTMAIFSDQQKLANLVKLSSCDVRKTFKLSGETWKKMEVALVVLGRFSEDIIVFQSKQQASFDIESFVTGIVKQIKDEDYYSLLKGQSLYCLTRFTEIISIKYRNLFPQLIIACFYCLESQSIAVKVIACRALAIFMRKVEKHSITFTEEQQAIFVQCEPILRIGNIHPFQQIANYILESLIELCKSKKVTQKLAKPSCEYLLNVFHRNAGHDNTMQLFFSLLNECCSFAEELPKIINNFVTFILECLKAYRNIVNSDQKSHLKSFDTDLIMMVLKITNILVQKSEQLKQEAPEAKMILELVPILTQIIEGNQEVQIHTYVTICLKSIIKVSHKKMAESEDLVSKVVGGIRNLLKIPADKSFESASVYAGNLAILTFETLLKKKNYQILQESVLKVFRSRTPSVIQSLVLIFSRIINAGTNKNKPFDMRNGNIDKNIHNIVDFLASFSIENRMGLKILIDKWLLQQSLFRGKYTKISTFMALSKLFLLRDKRVDNLLVIGFNPSHTSVCNDVNAPLKILATLIRCMDNEMGDKQDDQNDQNAEFEIKEDNTVDVELQKFKEEKTEMEVGGLADRENQQGSTCYMSAMLEFYDDGEECDETTEEDLIFLGDSSVDFKLGEYLIEFFNYLQREEPEYLRECLNGILKQDRKTLEKYVKIK